MYFIESGNAIHTELITASVAAKGQLGTDVFVSYSRKNSDFARHLNIALQEAGKTTWFDQESISTGMDFEKEIFKGIGLQPGWPVSGQCEERDLTVRLWDVETQVPLSGLSIGPDSMITSVAFSSDGRHLASAGLDSYYNEIIILWNVETQAFLGKLLTGPYSTVTSVAFSLGWPASGQCERGSGRDTVGY